MLLVLHADTELACSIWRHDKFAFGRADGAFRTHRYTSQKHPMFAISVSFLSSTPSWITPLHTDWSCFERLSTLSQPLHTWQYITTVHPRHWVVGQWYGAESFLNLNHYSRQCRHRRAGHLRRRRIQLPRWIVENYHLCHWNHNEASAIAGKSYRQRRYTRWVFSPHPRARSATTINLHCVASSFRQTVGLECVCCC
jgi:hypothetical protein